MNLQEFAALKAGDKVVNHMSGGSVGEVTEANEKGVRVRWGLGVLGTSSITFQYNVQGTAWFHWDKIEATEETTNETTS